MSFSVWAGNTAAIKKSSTFNTPKKRILYAFKSPPWPFSTQLFNAKIPTERVKKNQPGVESGCAHHHRLQNHKSSLFSQFFDLKNKSPKAVFT